MKICIPIVGKNKALVNLLAEDFYKANFYCVHDILANENEVFSKSELMTRFGLNFRTGSSEDDVMAIISQNMRSLAYKILVDNGIKVFKAQGKLVDENLRLYKQKQLNEYDASCVEEPISCGSSCSSCSSTACQ